MTLWAVIPMRSFAFGKSRLSAILDQRARIELNRQLFTRTTTTAAHLLGEDRVLVASPDPEVIEAADGLGILTMMEPKGAGLNTALNLAHAAVLEKGATAMMSLSCDLPLLTEDDIAAAIALWSASDTMVLAPDEAGRGTNALILPTGTSFLYEMGAESAARHRLAARNGGLTYVEINRPGLAFDLDTQADLTRWYAIVERQSS